MSTSLPSPNRGEVWDVNLDPTVGAEIKKIRPVVVVSSDAIHGLPVRLVAPIREWKPHLNAFWFVRLDPDKSNGLSKSSVVDALQLRGVDIRRFIEKRGHLSAVAMQEITAAIAAVVEYQ